MFAPVQTEEIAPSDDARAVCGGGREIRALAEGYFGGHPAARKTVDQMALRAERDVAQREARRAVLDLDQVTRQIDVRRLLSQLAESQRFVREGRAGHLKTIRPYRRAAREGHSERRLPGQVVEFFPCCSGRRRGECERTGLRFHVERKIFDRLDFIEPPAPLRRWRRVTCRAGQSVV